MVVEIIYLQESEIEGFPSCVEFMGLAGKVPNAISYQFGLAAAKDESGSPDSTALALVRIMIQNSERFRKDQKFIVIMRFWMYGDVISVDLVSLDKEYHRNIAGGYLNLWGNDLSGNLDVVLGTVPYLITGGHVCRSEEIAKFNGTSGDFGNLLFGVEINHLASYLLGYTTIGTDATGSKLGEQLMQNIFSHVLKFKQEKTFYERTYDLLLERMPRNIYAQHLGALVAMKAWDRTATEGGEYLQHLVEETAGGGDSLGAYMTVMGYIRRQDSAGSSA
jgi:hypothetical protein